MDKNLRQPENQSHLVCDQSRLNNHAHRSPRQCWTSFAATGALSSPECPRPPPSARSSTPHPPASSPACSVADQVRRGAKLELISMVWKNRPVGRARSRRVWSPASHIGSFCLRPGSGSCHSLTLWPRVCMCSLLSRVLDGGARAPSPKPCSSARVRRAATRSRDDWPLVSEVGARASQPLTLASRVYVFIVQSSTGRRSSSPVAHNPVRRRESARPQLAPATTGLSNAAPLEHANNSPPRAYDLPVVGGGARARPSAPYPATRIGRTKLLAGSVKTVKSICEARGQRSTPAFRFLLRGLLTELWLRVIKRSSRDSVAQDGALGSGTYVRIRGTP